jgi:hypothetical protein
MQHHERRHGQPQGRPVGDADSAERQRFGVVADKITEIDIDADPARLSRFNLALLDSSKRPSTGEPGL